MRDPTSHQIYPWKEGLQEMNSSPLFAGGLFKVCHTLPNMPLFTYQFLAKKGSYRLYIENRLTAKGVRVQGWGGGCWPG